VHRAAAATASSKADNGNVANFGMAITAEAHLRRMATMFTAAAAVLFPEAILLLDAGRTAATESPVETEEWRSCGSGENSRDEGGSGGTFMGEVNFTKGSPASAAES
jgi:hypothetical protein